MFAEVFYSNRKEVFWKEYGKAFKDAYPNVYKLISAWKSSDKHIAINEYMSQNNIIIERKTTALAVAMMSLESKIFHEILTKLYAKRIRAVHIHDAIVIPDVKGTQSVKIETVTDIFYSSYKKYGLVPNLSIE